VKPPPRGKICIYTYSKQFSGGTDMPKYLVSWSGMIEATSKSEASVKALAALNDPDEWQFNASVEEDPKGIEG
jgi:hypothetical protein